MMPQIQMTQVASNEPTTNFSEHNLLRIGRNNKSFIYRLLLQFPITAIPAAAIITSAALKLYMQLAGTGQQAAIISPYAIDSSWDINSVTWDTQPSFHASLIGSRQKAGLTLIQHIFDITSLVQHWHNRSIPNDGLLLKTNETTDQSLTNVQADMFNSAYIPLVEINYVLPCDCICQTTAFVENIEEIGTNDTDQYSLPRNTSLSKTLTFLIQNTGCTPVTANIQISPDGIHYVDDPIIKLIRPEELQPFVPCIFSKFTRIRARNINPGATSSLVIWYQAQE
jgi:hypothetical protein